MVEIRTGKMKNQLKILITFYQMKRSLNQVEVNWNLLQKFLLSGYHKKTYLKSSLRCKKYTEITCIRKHKRKVSMLKLLMITLMRLETRMMNILLLKKILINKNLHITLTITQLVHCSLTLLMPMRWIPTEKSLNFTVKSKRKKSMRKILKLINKQIAILLPPQ